MSIELVKVNAKIEVGSISVETPFIQSFSVNKTRGQSSTFSASLKVSATTMSSVSGGDVKIYAGVLGGTKLIYTGIVKSASLSPCWDDPGYVFLNISGTDVLSLLQGKKYTRRCIASSHTWVSIDGVARPGHRSGRFDFQIGELHLGGDYKNPESPNNEVGVPLNTSKNQAKVKQDPSSIPVLLSIEKYNEDDDGVV